MFRTMKEGADGLPVVGRAGDRLGVRIPPESAHPDIHPDANGLVHPEHEGKPAGMSVTLDDPRFALPHRLPRVCGGISRHVLFDLEQTSLGPSLKLVADQGHHAVVVPDATCHLEDYETALAATRPNWRKTDVTRFPPLP